MSKGASKDEELDEEQKDQALAIGRRDSASGVDGIEI